MGQTILKETGKHALAIPLNNRKKEIDSGPHFMHILFTLNLLVNLRLYNIEFTLYLQRRKMVTEMDLYMYLHCTYDYKYLLYTSIYTREKMI